MVVAGVFVFISGRLLVAGRLVVPPPTLFILALVADASVELVAVFWPQPTSANAARMVMADREMIDFISSFILVDVY